MQKFINIITKAALAVSVTLLATSCVMDKEEMPDSLHRVIVQMSVSVEGMTKAEAEANKLLAESITSELIDYKYYETWNGELPAVMGTDTTIIRQPE